MSNLQEIRSNLVKLFKEKRVEAFMTLALFLAAIIALVIQVLELTGLGNLIDQKHKPSIILGLLAILAIDFFLERLTIMQRADRGLHSINDVSTQLDSLRDQLSSSGVLDFVLDLPANIKERVLVFGKSHKKIEILSEQCKEFRDISDFIIRRQRDVLTHLSNGEIDVPLELGVDMHIRLMKLFKERMDAVSYNDLALWSNIIQDYEPGARDLEIDFGRRYYYHINAVRTLDSTIVTRIFLLDRNHINNQESKELLAKILDRHLADGIGIAIAFEDNFSQASIDWLRRGPRRDFSLLNKNQAATFFRQGRESEEKRFRAILYSASQEARIEEQRRFHKTLVCASILGTPSFEQQVREAYSDDEWGDILRRIELIRKSKSRTQSDSPVFTTQLRDLSRDEQIRLNEITRRIESALVESRHFGPVIEPF